MKWLNRFFLVAFAAMMAAIVVIDVHTIVGQVSARRAAPGHLR